MAVAAHDLTQLEERVRKAAGVPTRTGDGVVELLPGSLREVARAQAVKGMLGQDAERVVVSLVAFDRIEAPDPAACTIRVGAGANLGEVEATLQGWALTLGWLSPKARSLTVRDWLEGRHAGLRAVPGNRLESAALSLGVALRSGGLFVTPAAPRSSGGPMLETLFLGRGGQAGTLVEAQLRALPRPELEETFHALVERPEDVVLLLRGVAASDVRPVEVHTRRKGRGFAVAITVATYAFRARRDRALVEGLLKGRGEPRAVGQVGGGAPEFEGELGWDRLAGAIGSAGPLGIYRIARESVVVAARAPVKGAVALDSPPAPLPAPLLGILDGAGQEVA